MIELEYVDGRTATGDDLFFQLRYALYLAVSVVQETLAAGAYPLQHTAMAMIKDLKSVWLVLMKPLLLESGMVDGKPFFHRRIVVFGK